MSSTAPPYHYESVDGYSVVTLNSSLNDVQWANIERIGSDLLAQLAPIKTPAVLVDLSSLSYVGSAMVALVVRVWKAINERGGRMVVVNRHEMVLEVLRLAGLASVWTIVPTREEGLNTLGVEARAARGGSGNALVLILALAAAIAALVGTVTPLVSPGALSADAVRILALAGGAASLVLGTVLAIRGADAIRGLGVLVVLIGASAVAVRGMGLNHSKAPAPSKSESAEPAPSKGEETKPSKADTPAAEETPEAPAAK